MGSIQFAGCSGSESVRKAIANIPDYFVKIHSNSFRKEKDFTTLADKMFSYLVAAFNAKSPNT